MFQGLQILNAVPLDSAEAQNFASYSSFLRGRERRKARTAPLNRAQMWSEGSRFRVRTSLQSTVCERWLPPDIERWQQ